LFFGDFKQNHTLRGHSLTPALMQVPPFSQPKIFLVGYPRGYRLELAEAFADQGYEVAGFEDARLAAHTLSFECPDAVVMNWAVTPPLTTMAFVERYGGVLPVLILSRHNVLIDVVQSLKSGAADFIRTPCYFPEILARVQRAQAALPLRKTLTIGKLSLDVESSVAHIENVSVQLTKREARILATLIRCPEQAVSRDALMRVADITDVKSTIIESYIKQLRQKHPVLRRCIRTKYGQGYAYFQGLEGR